MVRFPRWLMLALVVVLIGAFLAQAVLAGGNTAPAPVSQVAQDGLALGLLASSGAITAPTLAPTASPTPVATSTPTDQPTAAPQPTDAPTQPPAPTPNGKVIFIDPGHGGSDSGAVHTGPGGVVDLTEKDVNLDVSLRLADLLRQAGYDVQMSRTTDTFAIPGASTPVELQQRIDMANAAHADLYICVHHNSSVNSAANGLEVFYCADRTFSDSNLRLAQLVHDSLLRDLSAAGYNATDLGIQDDASEGHLAVLAPHNMARATQMPGILGEALFMSNDADAAALARPEIRQAEAQGYFDAINAYFGF